MNFLSGVEFRAFTCEFYTKSNLSKVSASRNNVFSFPIAHSRLKLYRSPRRDVQYNVFFMLYGRSAIPVGIGASLRRPIGTPHGWEGVLNFKLIMSLQPIYGTYYYFFFLFENGYYFTQIFLFFRRNPRRNLRFSFSLYSTEVYDSKALFLIHVSVSSKRVRSENKVEK